MAMIVSGAFAVAGMIHLLPLRGLAGDDALAALYGVEVRDATTRVLLRHRALQLGLLGVLLGSAAWRVELRPAAWLAGVVSAGGFLAMVGRPDAQGPRVARVWWADVVALAALAVAACGGGVW